MAHDLLFTELLENNTIKGCDRVWEPGSGNCFLPGCLPAANCALAAAWRVPTADMLGKSCGCRAKRPAGGHASSRSETGLLHLSARSTPIRRFSHTQFLKRDIRAIQSLW